MDHRFLGETIQVSGASSKRAGSEVLCVTGQLVGYDERGGFEVYTLSVGGEQIKVYVKQESCDEEPMPDLRSNRRRNARAQTDPDSD